jgi:hypothetical protein
LSQSIQTSHSRQTNSGVTYIVATVVLFALLSGVLAYAYPHFLPGPPEQAVRRFLVAHQAGTWDYVGYVLTGPTHQREGYIQAASRCRLVGFQFADSYTRRMRWATGTFGQTETVRVREYYTSADGQRQISIQVDYVLQRRGGQWFIELDSILGEGGIRRYLYSRGVPV